MWIPWAFREAWKKLRLSLGAVVLKPRTRVCVGLLAGICKLAEMFIFRPNPNSPKKMLPIARRGLDLRTCTDRLRSGFTPPPPTD